MKERTRISEQTETRVGQEAPCPKEVVSRFYRDVFIRHDLSHLDEYMRDDYIQHSITTGTHTGEEWLGQPATGNQPCFDVVDIFRAADGKIAEHCDVADTHLLHAVGCGRSASGRV